ncbi:hypothetical protein MIT9_P0653 [Methylomarinovum caldicuralii]|uniref:CBS domain-containing protein n=1 Tax=Methylomarinovum caldicuralii TaxID=438856 RepID=A0AAU9C1Q3_9GAMM|nr:CBS domain-containing protein [Methylomarinovum caldicuralii]BCX81075.1 hypothetical protein MIT9_P0653 [Methylomarinovum caldicuralii]
MTVGNICNREVVIVHRDEDVLAAARLMRQFHVGSVVVVEEQDGKRIPVGIVTDRDIVVKVLARGLEPAHLRVQEIMSAGAETVAETAEILPTVERMRDAAIRRLPVVAADGSLVGIVTLDDLIDLLAEMLGDLARLVKREQQREVRTP